MTRTSIIAELATNWSGSEPLAHEMVKSAAANGADIVKVQLFDASTLNDLDPQKAWLTAAQIDRPMLDRLISTAAKANVKLTASVFGIPQAIEAHAAGLETIKIGSGEGERHDLIGHCRQIFRSVWVSEGLIHRPRPNVPTYNVVPFYGVSQYPTPYFRGLARLHQADKTGTWGWSDHGENLEVAKEAILHGATYVERHYTLGIGKGCRHDAWDTSYDQLRELRKFADDCAWGAGVKEYDDAVKRFVGRWGA